MYLIIQNSRSLKEALDVWYITYHFTADQYSRDPGRKTVD